MTNELSQTVQNADGQSYFIGSLFTEIGSTRFYVSEDLLRAVVYKGTSKKAIVNLNFNCIEDLREWFKTEETLAQKKFEAKLKNATYTHRMHVGSILMARTEDDVLFYQVVKAESPKTIFVREIEGCVDESGKFCIPRVGMFNSELLSKRVLSNTSVKIKSELEGFLMTDFRVLEYTGSKIYAPVPVSV